MDMTRRRRPEEKMPGRCPCAHIVDEVIALLVGQEALEDKGPWRPADLLHLPPPHLLQAVKTIKFDTRYQAIAPRSASDLIQLSTVSC